MARPGLDPEGRRDTEDRPRPTLPLFTSGDPPFAERVEDILAEGFGR